MFASVSSAISSSLHKVHHFLPLYLTRPQSSSRVKRKAGAGGHGKGKERKRRDSLVFLLPNSPRAPLGEGCERRLGTSQQLYQNNATLSLQYVTLHFRDRYHRNHRSCLWTEALSGMVSWRHKTIRYSVNTAEVCKYDQKASYSGWISYILNVGY